MNPPERRPVEQQNDATVLLPIATHRGAQPQPEPQPGAHRAASPEPYYQGAPRAEAEATALLPVIEATGPIGAAAPLDPPGEPPAASGSAGGGAEGGGAARNSALMAIGSLVSRGTGFLRTAVMAMALGGAAVGNAYTTAQVFPGMIYELLLGGIMSSVLVPMLVRARKQDRDQGQAYTQRLLSLAVIVLGISTILAVLCAPLLAIAYSSEESTDAFRDVVTALSYLMLPTIFFYGLSGLCGAILNARHSFFAPMWTPILNNIVVIATGVYYMVTFGTGKIEPEEMTPERILVLGGGVLLGIVLQSLGLLPALRRAGFRWKWRMDFRKLHLSHLGKVGAWMFAYVAVNQLALLVLFNLLNRVPQENNAGAIIYNNVFLLLMMAHGIVAVSVITAVLPRMSAAALDGRAGDIAGDLSRGIRMCTVLLAPIAVCYAVLALPIAITLFERGAFERQDSVNTTLVLVVAGITLVPMSISQLFNFTYYSLQDTKTPALINLPVVALRLSVQLAWFAMFAVSVTAAGMMVGNGISFLAAGLLSALLLRRRIGALGLRGISVALVKATAAALVAAAAGYGTLRLLDAGQDMSQGKAWLALFAGAAMIGGVYVAVALVLRTRELNDVFGLIRRKVGR
jgi:putative peptidoglycan lipid II flippase